MQIEILGTMYKALVQAGALHDPYRCAHARLVRYAAQDSVLIWAALRRNALRLAKAIWSYSHVERKRRCYA